MREESLEEKTKLSPLVPGTEEWNRILNADLPNYKVTEETRKTAKRNALRYRSSVRLAMGNIYTDEEFEAYREKVLSTPLP